MRVLAIGDIHGCSKALDTILAAVQLRPDDQIITLGDCIDRGPDSMGVIERLLGQLDATELPDVIAIAKAPMEIRGYGPVKDIAIAKVKPEVERLLANLTAPSTAKMRAYG